MGTLVSRIALAMLLKKQKLIMQEMSRLWGLTVWLWWMVIRIFTLMKMNKLLRVTMWAMKKVRNRYVIIWKNRWKRCFRKKMMNTQLMKIKTTLTKAWRTMKKVWNGVARMRLEARYVIIWKNRWMIFFRKKMMKNTQLMTMPM